MIALLGVDLDDVRAAKAAHPDLADAVEVSFLSLDRLHGRADLTDAYVTPRAKVDRRFDAALTQLRFAVYSSAPRLGTAIRVV